MSNVADWHEAFRLLIVHVDRDQVGRHGDGSLCMLNFAPVASIYSDDGRLVLVALVKADLLNEQAVLLLALIRLEYLDLEL